jgi:FixJ family two-component response regulator
MDAPDVNVDPADCREECGEASNIAIVDEEIFARVLIRLLNIFGYSATAFRDAASFLDAFRRAPRRFDCLITDSHLPETTGTETRTITRLPVPLLSKRRNLLP